MSTLTVSRNQSMECAKLVASFFVVAIHVPFPGDFGNVISCLSRFAVPMFFAISGYFSYGAGADKLAKRMAHIFQLNLIATLLCILSKYMRMSDWNAGMLLKLQQLMPSWENVAKWVFLHINPFSGELWYLTAIWFCYGAVWGYVRFFGEKPVCYRPLYIISLTLFLIRFAVGDLLRFSGVDIPFYIFRDGWFEGLPMFSMGIFLRQYRQQIFSNFQLTSKKLLLLFAAGFALSFLQWEQMGMMELPLGTVLQVAVLILLTAANPKLGTESAWKNTLIAKFGSLSTMVYILHYQIYEDYRDFFQYRFQEILGGKEEWLRPVVILSVTLVVSLLVGYILDAGKRLWARFAK